MLNARIVWFVLLTVGCSGGGVDIPETPFASVMPHIGTGGGAFGQGQAFVGATLPFGFAKPGPDSSGFLMRGFDGFAHTSGYWYLDTYIDGFSQTHLHGTGIEDYGHLLLMPTDGMDSSKTTENGYRQSFSHDTEVTEPGYYSVTLEDTGITAELTAQSHTAFHRYSFADASTPTIIIDVGHAIGGDGKILDTNVTYDPASRAVSGWLDSAGRFTGEANSFKVYFSLTFDAQPTAFGMWTDGVLADAVQSAQGPDVGVYLSFPADVVSAEIGLSLISVEQAAANREAQSMPFDDARALAKASWETLLDQVQVLDYSAQEKKVFYTALYHSYLLPTQLTEPNGQYLGLDRNVHDSPGWRFLTDLSLWDTYRTTNPLYNLLQPQIGKDVAKSLQAMSNQIGYVPRWPLAVNEKGTMLGAPGQIVLADAILKNVPGLEPQAILEIAKADAFLSPNQTIRNEYGQCLPKGYCPAGVVDRPVAKAMEYGWADFAILNLAVSLDDQPSHQPLLDQMRIYAGHWDDSTKFFRGKFDNGTWTNNSSFEPKDQTDDYAEGNAWQYLWATPYDIGHVAELFGGRDAMLEKLTFFFDESKAAAPKELSEGFLLPDDYYWHGNEPDIHAAYLFSMLGEPDMSAEWVDWVRRSKYNDTPQGLNGNDDAGTLSAWYVWTALGLYPIAGSDLYVIGSPVGGGATVTLGANQLQVIVERDSDDAIYVANVTINGIDLARPYIKHSDIAQGAEIIFTMSSKPTQWGSGSIMETLPAGL